MTDEEKDQIHILLYSLVTKESYGISVKTLMDGLPDYSRLSKLKLTDILIVYDMMLEKGVLIETDGQVLPPNWRDIWPYAKSPLKIKAKKALQSK